MMSMLKAWHVVFGIALAVAVRAAGEGAVSAPVWRQTFADMPSDWEVQGKPGVAKAVFAAGFADGTNRVLRMTADKASGTFKSGKLAVDLNKTPVMRWCWKAVTLPDGGDGRSGKSDDQAIGLYVSAGGMFSQQSVAFRWETETPKGAEGRAKYGAGIVSISWHCLRNKSDLGTNGWFVEEANVGEAFQKAFGAVPARVGFGVSCNSQYTGTKAEALLDWVEFAPAAAGASVAK